SVGDVVAGVTAVVRAVEAPMVLKKESIGIRSVLRDLVDALPELGMRVRKELRAHAAILDLPASAAVVRAVGAARRGGDHHSPGALGIHEDGVEAKPASARLPLRAVRMVPE